MIWWAWLLVSFGIGTVVGTVAGVVLWVGSESMERRRGGMLDLVGAKPLDPDDWFLDAPVSKKEWAGVVVKPPAHLRPGDAPPSPAVPPKR